MFIQRTYINAWMYCYVSFSCSVWNHKIHKKFVHQNDTATELCLIYICMFHSRVSSWKTPYTIFMNIFTCMHIKCCNSRNTYKPYVFPENFEDWNFLSIVKFLFNKNWYNFYTWRSSLLYSSLILPHVHNGTTLFFWYFTSLRLVQSWLKLLN